VKALLAHAALLALPAALLGAAATPHAIAIALLMLAFGAIESRAARVDAIRFGAPGTRLALASALLLLVTTWLALAASASTWLGAPLALAGIALRAWSIRSLGPAFVSEAVTPRVRVRRGPYAIVRHPSELGLLAIALGVVLLGTSAWSLGAFAALATTSFVRMRAEDQLPASQSA
jgi:protein-S-isoprenylcysteine O-methyltransferase Ste14